MEREKGSEREREGKKERILEGMVERERREKVVDALLKY